MTQTSSTNERQIRLMKRRVKKDALVEREALVAVMRTLNGRRWIWLTLERAQAFHADSNIEPQALAYNAGKRAEGLRLLMTLFAHTPDDCVRMITENSSLRLTDDGEQEEEEEDG